MTAHMSPYLSFRGDAAAAFAFYQSVFGGELSSNTFGEFGAPDAPADQIMHAALEVSGFTLMGSDVPPGMDYADGARIRVILHGDDEDTLRRWWNGLADGADVEVELATQMWGDTYGALTDRFGIGWQVNITTGDAPTD